MSYLDFFLLLLAGITAGFVNTTIGGGWFILFPSVFSLGLSPVVSNITTTCTLLGGYYFHERRCQKSWRLAKNNYLIFAISILGGLTGACALVFLMPWVFELMGPYLLLVSWLIFVFQNKITEYLLNRSKKNTISFEYSHSKLLPLLILSIYGTYIGAGIGIFLKFFFSSYRVRQQFEIEKIKYYFIILNGISGMSVFIASGLIEWPYLLITLTGAIVGSHISGFLNKRHYRKLQSLIVIIGAVVMLYFLKIIRF